MSRWEVVPWPSKQIESGHGDTWRSTGADPQIRLKRKDGTEEFGQGWYRLSIAFEAGRQPADQCALYPDYGSGFLEKDRIPISSLAASAGSSMSGVIPLKHSVRRLRFDPCHSPQEVSIGRCTLAPLSRASVITRLLWRERRESIGAWRYRIQRAVRQARRHGWRSAVEQLYAAHIGTLVLPGLDYEEWLRRYENAPLAPGAGVVEGPLVSVILPTYNTNPVALAACIESVLGQHYGNWELCIADDASTCSGTLDLLRERASEDQRIKLAFREENGHISPATNTALELASGEFAVLLDHDDCLHPHALHEIAIASAQNPLWDLIYSDEDKIDANGQRCDPYFKPDFNLDLLRAQNCISHVGAYRMRVLREIGGLRVGFEGSQDWDLALRFVERVGDRAVGHIPRVLYHWRKSQTSTASSSAAKPYASSVALRAIGSHLQRTAPGATVETIEGQPGNYRVRHPSPSDLPKVSVIIPSRDQAELLGRCVASIRETTHGERLEFILVDNGSQSFKAAELFARFAEEGAIVIRDDQAFNYSRLNNIAAARATGELLLFVNDDVEATHDGWLAEMRSHALRGDVGAVGAKLYYPDGRIQHAGVVLGGSGIAANVGRGEPPSSSGSMNRLLLAQNYSAVTAACMVMRKAVFDAVGGFDESLAVDFNDVDLCLRLRERGWLVVWTPYARLFHHESPSRGAPRTEFEIARALKEQEIFISRWWAWMEADPAYNVNLELDPVTSGLAWPPRSRGRVLVD